MSTAASETAGGHGAQKIGWSFGINGMARRMLLSRWDEGLKDTRLIVREGPNRTIIGRQDDGAGVETVELNVNNPRVFARTLSLGSLGLGEAYMDEDYDVAGGLERLYMALARNRLNFKSRRDPLFLLKYLLVLLHNRLVARHANLDAHYALGDDLYERMLDPLMIYTAGYATSKDDTLETMQGQKLDRICRKLRLVPGETLVDFGCGWGGLLIYAAQNYGVRGVGVNICREQAESAIERVRQAGLGERIDIRIGDFRAVPGTFDKVTSIGMIEHLRPSEYNEFAATIARRLRPGGLSVIDGIFNGAASNEHDPFIQKYIFPDSNQALLSEITRAFELAGLAVLDLNNTARSYYLTMLRWQENFEKKRHQLDPVRYPPRFIRMWQVYIAWGLACARYSTGANYEILLTNDFMRDHPLGRV